MQTYGPLQDNSISRNFCYIFCQQNFREIGILKENTPIKIVLLFSILV